MDVLIEVTACFPVYRTYIRNLDVPDSAKLLIERAIEEARMRRPQLSPDVLVFLRDVLTLSNPPHILSDQREERLAFVMRWQQFTGPIVAKGLEDTALYVYYPLLVSKRSRRESRNHQRLQQQDFHRIHTRAAAAMAGFPERHFHS